MRTLFRLETSPFSRLDLGAVTILSQLVPVTRPFTYASIQKMMLWQVRHADLLC